MYPAKAAKTGKKTTSAKKHFHAATKALIAARLFAHGQTKKMVRVLVVFVCLLSLLGCVLLYDYGYVIIQKR